VAQMDSLNHDQTLLVKMDPVSDTIAWAKKLYIDGGIIQPVKLIARDDGNILLGANSWSGATGFTKRHILFLLINPNGQIFWQKRTGSDNYEGLRDFVLDNEQNIYFAGEIYNAHEYGYDVLLGKLSPSGEIILSRSYNFRRLNYPESIVFDGKDKFYIGGTSDATGIPARIAFLAQMNNLLEIIHSKEVGIDTIFSEIDAIVIGRQNKIHFLGRIADLVYDFVFSDNMETNEVYQFDWGRVSSAWTSGDSVFIHDYQLSILGFIYDKKLIVKGYYADPWPDFISYDATYDEVIGHSYNRSGDGNWKVYIINHSNNYFSDCAFREFERNYGIVVQPYFKNVIFKENPVGLSTVPAQDIFIKDQALNFDIHCESYDTSKALERYDQTAISLFPNPVNSRLFIEFCNDQKAIILDSMGNFVREEIISTEGIDVADLMHGLYFIKIGSCVMKFLKF
jgi:hypothetical protein